MKSVCAMVGVAGVVAAAGTAWGSPALDIRSVGAGPVQAGNAPAGPVVDPTTQNGQWFLKNDGTEDYRTHEHFDNIDGHGGGPNNHLAIRGGFAGYSTNTSGLISGYQLNVSITNNTPNRNGAWQSAPNAHGETMTASPNYVGTMYGVRFAAHWADDGNPTNFNLGGANLGSPNPAGGGTSPGTSNTTAANYDALAWYSYTNGNAASPPGAYQVPSWDFGDIAVGQTVTRMLTFQFYTPLAASAVPSVTQLANLDFLIARTTDLKIASYFQADPVLNLVSDSLSPYPLAGVPGAFSPWGNSSVFFEVPAPGSVLVVAGGGALGLRRRRR